MFKVKNILIAIVVIILILFIKFSEGTVDSSELRIGEAQKGAICEYIKLRGKVELDSREKVFSQVSGVISSINAREGDYFKKNQVLAALDTRDVEISLKKSEANYQSSIAQLEDLKNSIKIEQIKQAEEQLGQARIFLQSSETDFNYKKDRLERIIELLKKGSVAEQEQKDAKNQYAAAESVLNDARKKIKIAEYNLQLLKKGASEHAIKAAEFNSEQAKIQIEEFKSILDKCYIKSGIDGTILAKHFDNGAYVQPGTLLYESGDYQSAYIKVELLVDDMAKIKIGQNAVISGDAIGGEKLPATVYFIAPRAFTKISSLGVEQQKIELRLKYDTQKYIFRPGYELDVNILTGEKTEAIYVPYKAVFESGGKNHLFKINAGTVELKQVKTGIENDDYIEISDGIAARDRVIIDPPNYIKHGNKIKGEFTFNSTIK
ncbi:MAG: efflux RND transporter periplasmic adaptor subunit [Candidatus Wallbacteria bacterium]